MLMFHIDYGTKPSELVSTPQELDAVLDRATEESQQEECPYLVQIYPVTDNPSKTEPMLKLGVGRSFSFLDWDMDYVPGELDGGEETTWEWSGPMEKGPGVGIPNEVAREAAREFVRTGGRRPTNVEWVAGEWQRPVRAEDAR